MVGAGIWGGGGLGFKHRLSRADPQGWGCRSAETVGRRMESERTSSYHILFYAPPPPPFFTHTHTDSSAPHRILENRMALRLLICFPSSPKVSILKRSSIYIDVRSHVSASVSTLPTKITHKGIHLMPLYLLLA